MPTFDLGSELRLKRRSRKSCSLISSVPKSNLSISDWNLSLFTASQADPPAGKQFLQNSTDSYRNVTKRAWPPPRPETGRFSVQTTSIPPGLCRHPGNEPAAGLLLQSCRISASRTDQGPRPGRLWRLCGFTALSHDPPAAAPASAKIPSEENLQEVPEHNTARGSRRIFHTAG